MLLAIPLTWRRILLVAAMIAGFVLLFPLPAVRSFYALELPHGRALAHPADQRDSAPPR